MKRTSRAKCPASARSAKVKSGFASDRALLNKERIVLSPNRAHFGGPLRYAGHFSLAK
jgi:hypothetical protein